MRYLHTYSHLEMPTQTDPSSDRVLRISEIIFEVEDPLLPLV